MSADRPLWAVHDGRMQTRSTEVSFIERVGMRPCVDRVQRRHCGPLERSRTDCRVGKFVGDRAPPMRGYAYGAKEAGRAALTSCAHWRADLIVMHMTMGHLSDE